MANQTTEAILTAQFRQGLQRAVDSYQSFQQGSIPQDAKGFTAYHNACKAALLHIALLLKLIPEKATDLNETDWLNRAREALNTTEDSDDDLFPD